MPIAESTAAIISAIIGASATAAATATSEIASEVRRESGGVAGVITNRGRFQYRITAMKPNHGQYIQGPSAKLYTPGDIEDSFLAAAKERYGANPTEDEINNLLTEWEQPGGKFEQAESDKLVTKFCTKGAGMGSEYLITLGSHYYFPVICLLLRKLPGGSYGGGICICQLRWYQQNQGDDTGSGIIARIKSQYIEPSVAWCQYSDGGGNLQVINKENPGDGEAVVVTMSAPGEVINFTIDTPKVSAWTKISFE